MARGWPLIEKARRMLAREDGALVKNWGGRLPIALVYPSPYHVGMSSLGMQTVYGLLNSYDDIVCERVFLNFGRDLNDIEPVSVESQRPLRDFPVIGFSLSFELDYVNVARILAAADVPLLATERLAQPLVIAGGPAISANPAPLAPYLDAVLVGEIEDVADDLVRGLAAVADGDAEVESLGAVPGVYVPSRHHERGAVSRVWAHDLASFRTETVVASPDTEFANMHLVEVARGCMRGCRFCLAGHVYRPVRERPASVVLEMARAGAARGRTVGLVAPSLSDARSLRPVLHQLVAEGARVSISSLRADTLDDGLMADLAAAGNEAITIAPEAGCARLRQLIGKDLDEDAVLQAAALAQKHGFRELKLYFIVGLPTETEDDVREAAALVRRVQAVFGRQVVANVSCFVPKPSTPFQWQAFMPVAELERRLALFAAALAGTGVVVRGESAEWSLLQAVLARGDERAGLALAGIRAYSRKAIRHALEAGGLDLAQEAGPREVGAPLPWDVVEPGLPPGYLARRGAIAAE